MRSIIVSAAVVERDGTFLLTRRAKDSHLGGKWEFPGGKVEPGESVEDALVREIGEELACAATIGQHLLTTRHAYEEVHVELHFFTVTIDGEPVPQLGQEMRWVPRQELGVLPLPEADADLVALLTA
ncbi:MAG: (deoxy)nucleoside triphosphate pyrophosphohydrolase [Acidobacteria bacterium]|nr:(deoxy)nucleoside triphosphate pyrophosphohydrolase [Acidobacteriota bacterium]